MILAKQSRLHFYRDIPLYTETSNGHHVLYKKPGVTLAEIRVTDGLHPTQLYIDEQDKLPALREAQAAFNHQLADDINSGDMPAVKQTLIDVIDETFAEPRAGSLEGLSETAAIILDQFADTPQALIGLAGVSFNDYTTALHSINTMAFAVTYCIFHETSLEYAKELSLTALLHDVGKTQVPSSILAAPRKLTDEEFEIMKTHTVVGYGLLTNSRLYPHDVCLGALEHHERLDGSGYPYGNTDLSFSGRLLSLIDCYEAITNDDRPYRSAAEPFDALSLLKREVIAGKLDRGIFEKFAQCLTLDYRGAN